MLTCSAEDLAVLKSFADRPRDWADVETIVVRQQERLDWRIISKFSKKRLAVTLFAMAGILILTHIPPKYMPDGLDKFDNLYARTENSIG